MTHKHLDETAQLDCELLASENASSENAPTMGDVSEGGEPASGAPEGGEPTSVASEGGEPASGALPAEKPAEKPAGRRNNTEKNILIAFLLNISFSAIEFFGGFFTGSVAILSDAVHDLGDALSIGISWFLERKSKRKANAIYTYGYGRYSLVGSAITTAVLLVGSTVIIVGAVARIFEPTEINYSGMIAFAIFGVIVNSAAAFVTHKGDSLNQKAVNLHMLEDVLGWVVVLIGAVVMNFTDISLIDPLMSIAVALFILITAAKNFGETLDVFLEKAPANVDVSALCKQVAELPEVEDVHHLHAWSMDGISNYATLHVVTNASHADVKEAVRAKMREHGIAHVTIEVEGLDELCAERECCAE